MLLYDNPLSGNCYKVRLLLAQLGIAYDRRDVDVFEHSERPELLGDISPALRIPVLELDDGRTLAESGAILFHLAQGTDYLPEEPYTRAQVLQWMFFEQASLAPFIGMVRFWAMAGVHRSEKEIASRRKAGEFALGALDRHLRGHDFLVGERYTIADIAVYGYAHLAPEAGLELDPHRAVRDWLARVAAEPGHVAIETE